MQAPQAVKTLFAQYQPLIDAELKAIFDATPNIAMYDHLAYFMGFRNEALAPEVTYAGKRFRSALMLMLADWYGAKDRALPYAVALEFFHNFTLIHDDVVDRDEERRGRPTLWSLVGHDHAINDGDAGLIMTTQLLAEAAAGDNTRTQSYLLQKFLQVVEGQHRDFMLTDMSLEDPAASEEYYRTMIKGKTADLIVAATVGAGLISHQSQDELKLLKVYGHNLGMAFQVDDDVLSIWAEGKTTGKRDYGDILEKKKTLPVLYAYEALDPVGRAELTALYKQDTLSPADCESVVRLLDSVETLAHMETEIIAYAEKAKEAALKLSIPREQKIRLIDIVEALLPKV